MAGVRANLSRLWGRPGPPSPPPRPPRASRVGLPAAEVAGVGPHGEAVVVAGIGAVGDVTDGSGARDGDLVVLAFLTSSCQGCQEFWEDLARPVSGSSPEAGSGQGAGLPGAPRIAIITPGPELESRQQVAQKAPRHLPVVMTAQAWTDYDVTGSPFAVVVRGGRIAGEAPLFCWDDLSGLLERLAGPAPA